MTPIKSTIYSRNSKMQKKTTKTKKTIKKYTPNSKEKYMCAKHKKFFINELLKWKKDIIKLCQFHGVDFESWEPKSRLIRLIERKLDEKKLQLTICVITLYISVTNLNGKGSFVNKEKMSFILMKIMN